MRNLLSPGRISEKNRTGSVGKTGRKSAVSGVIPSSGYTQNHKYYGTSFWSRFGFKYVLFSPRKLGKTNPFWRVFFSNGLIQPPTIVFDVSSMSWTFPLLHTCCDFKITRYLPWFKCFEPALAVQGTCAFVEFANRSCYLSWMNSGVLTLMWSVKDQNPPQDDLRYQDLEMFDGIFLFSNRSFRESSTPFYLVNWDTFPWDVCSYLLFKKASNIATSCPPPQKKSVKISPSNNLISTFSQGNGSSNHVPLWWYCCLDVAGKCHHGSTFVAISRFGQDWVSDASVRLLVSWKGTKKQPILLRETNQLLKKPTPWKGTTPFRLIPFPTFFLLLEFLQE